MTDKRKPWVEPEVRQQGQVPPPGGGCLHPEGDGLVIAPDYLARLQATERGYRVVDPPQRPPRLSIEWGESLLNPRQREALGGALPPRVGYTFRDPPPDYVVGVDAAAPGRRDQTVVVVINADARKANEGVGKVRVRLNKLGRRAAWALLRSRWRRVRPRFYAGASVDFEPRDWWVGLYGPTDRTGDTAHVHLYVGLGLPWVLHLRFTAEGK